MLKKYKKAQVSQTNELFRIIPENYLLCYPQRMMIELKTFGFEARTCERDLTQIWFYLRVMSSEFDFAVCFYFYKDDGKIIGSFINPPSSNYKD